MLTLLATWIIGVVWIEKVNSYTNNSYQYQLLIRQDGLDNLKQHFLPLLDELIKSQIISPIHSGDFDTHSMQIESFHYDEISIKLDAASQTINLYITNFNVELKEFHFSAHKHLLFAKVTCTGSLRPRFDNWSFHFKITIHNTDNCKLNLDLDQSSVQITRGSVDLHKHFDDGICKATFQVFDFLFDVEDTLIKKQINKIPQMVRDAMQNKLDVLLPQTQIIEYHTSDTSDEIGICYKETDIVDDKLVIGVDFMFDDDLSYLSMSNQAVLDDSYVEQESDLNGLWIIMGLCAVSFLGGCCCLACIVVFIGNTFECIPCLGHQIIYKY